MNKDPDILFWLTVRAALIMFVKAIEKRYKIGDGKIVQIGATDSIATIER